MLKWIHWKMCDCITKVCLVQVYTFLAFTNHHLEYQENCWVGLSSIIIMIIILIMISNGNRTEWSPIQSVIIQVKKKSVMEAHSYSIIKMQILWSFNWRVQNCNTLILQWINLLCFNNKLIQRLAKAIGNTIGYQSNESCSVTPVHSLFITG